MTYTEYIKVNDNVRAVLTQDIFADNPINWGSAVHHAKPFHPYA